MNKIIQINLAGQAISIDEVAYATLSRYLLSLEKHFNNTESGNEILSDIESRIAELFYTKTKNDNSFITRAHVDEAIELMGSPEEMTEDEEPVEKATYRQERTYSAKSKKLLRDPEDRGLGGVCSGVGAYLGLDASIIRIITVLLVFAAGVPLLLYIILWIAMPMAKTPQDRYRMYGDANTVSDIANNIRNEAQTVANSVKDEATKFSKGLKKNSKLNSATSSLASGIDRIFKFCAKLFGAGILSVLVIVGITLSVALLSNATGGLEFHHNGNPFNTPPLLKSPTFNWIFSISMLSLLLIPIGTACYGILQYIFGYQSYINAKGIFLAWLISLALFIGISIYASGNVNVDSFREFGEQFENRGMFGKNYDLEYNYNQPEAQLDSDRDIEEPLDSPILTQTATLSL